MASSQTETEEQQLGGHSAVESGTVSERLRGCGGGPGGGGAGGPAGLGKGLGAAAASWRGGGEQSKRRRELKERGKSARSVSSVTSLNEAESGRCVSGVR